MTLDDQILDALHAPTLGEHNDIAAGLTRLAAWCGEVVRWYPRWFERNHSPRAVAARKEEADYAADVAAFREGLSAAAQAHGLTVDGNVLVRRRDVVVRVELHRSTARHFTGYHRAEAKVARVTIGDYGNKTSHPRPKAGWDFHSLVRKVLVRIEAEETARKNAAAAEVKRKASLGAAARVREAAGLPEGAVAAIVSGSEYYPDRVVVHLNRSLTEERAGALLKLIAAFDAEGK